MPKNEGKSNKNIAVEALKDTVQIFGLHGYNPSKIQLKENIQVIELQYNHYSKWIVLQNATLLAYTTIFLNFWGNSIFLNIILVIMMLSSLMTTLSANICSNRSYNTLKEKMRQMNNKK